MKFRLEIAMRFIPNRTNGQLSDLIKKGQPLTELSTALFLLNHFNNFCRSFLKCSLLSLIWSVIGSQGLCLHLREGKSRIMLFVQL